LRRKLEAFGWTLRIRTWLGSQYNRRPSAFLGLACGAAFTVFLSYSILRHLALQTTYFDLGLYASSFWKTTHGYDSWASLMFPSTVGHISHFSPLLGPIALIYSLIPDPVTLLVIQSVAIVSSVIPLYYLALRESGRYGLSLAIAGLLLVNPALLGIVRYDFHVEAFLPLFIFSLYYAYRSGKSRTYYLSLALLLSTIEYAAVLGLAVALSIWLEKRTMDRKILVATVSSAALVALLVASNTGALAFLNWPANWFTRQLYGGSNVGRAQDYVQPFLGLLPTLSAFQHDIGPKLFYLLVVFAPAGLTPLRSPQRILPALPWTVVVLASQRSTFYNLGFQYAAFLLPFVYVSAIPFLSTLYKPGRFLRFVGLGFIIIVVLSALVFGSPVSGQPWPVPSQLLGCMAQVRSTLPGNATLLTQNDLFPQLSGFPYATINSTLQNPPQYILVDVKSAWYNWTDVPLGYPVSMRQQVGALLNNTGYTLTTDYRGLRLYRISSTTLPTWLNDC